MLVLRRDVGRGPELATILLTLPDGRRVSVSLTATGHDWARLGIEAPEDVRVHRAEVQARIDAGEPRKRTNDTEERR